MINTIIESMAMLVTLMAYIYAVVFLFRKDQPLYFRIFGNAISCYALEEIWVLINTFFGQNDNMVSIRLVALFGCMSFLLAASMSCFEEIVGNVSTKKEKLVSLCAPAVMISILIFFAVLSDSVFFTKLIVIIAVSPAVISSYYNLKYLLMNSKENKYIDVVKPVNFMVLLFYLDIFSYFIMAAVASKISYAELFDFITAIIFALIIYFSKKGADKWKTLH